MNRDMWAGCVVVVLLLGVGILGYLLLDPMPCPRGKQLHCVTTMQQVPIQRDGGVLVVEAAVQDCWCLEHEP
jgi:hypothetical protein